MARSPEGNTPSYPSIPVTIDDTAFGLQRTWCAAGAEGADSRVRWACGCQPSTASSTKNPTTYAMAICQPCRTHWATDFASGKLFESATPAEDPNQIIEPPKPTA